MKEMLTGLMLLLFTTSPAIAEDPMASEATIKDLLVTMRVRSLIEGQMAQIETMIRSSTQKAFSKLSLNERQQKILEERKTVLVTIERQALNYESLEPTMIGIYRKSFTEREATDMLNFYKSNAGRALIEKMPLVMEQTMQFVQKMAEKTAPEIQQWERQTAEQLKAAE